MNKRSHPNHLLITIGGFGPGGYVVAYDGNRLVHFAQWPIAPPEELPAIPNPDWKTFRKELDEIGIWNWNKEYWDHDILDGTQWEVRIRWGRMRCTVNGSNCYPEADGSPSADMNYTPTFERFLKAVSTLVKGKEFR